MWNTGIKARPGHETVACFNRVSQAHFVAWCDVNLVIVK